MARGLLARDGASVARVLGSIMSVQSVSASAVPLDPAPARPRPSERGREKDPFVLPEEAAPAELARPQEKTQGKVKEPGKDADAPAAKEAKSEPAREPSAPSEAEAQAPAKPAESATAETKAATPEQIAKPAKAAALPAAPLDAAALVVIALAGASAPAEPKLEGENEATPTATEDSEPADITGDVVVDAATPLPDASALVVAQPVPDAAAPQAQAQLQVQIAVAGPALSPPVAPAQDAAVAAGDALPAEVAAASAAIPLGPVSGKPATARLQFAGAGLDSATDADAATPFGADEAGSEITAAAKPVGVPAGKEAAAPPSPTNGSGEFKPLEALQLGQPSIDLSALAQHRHVRPEAAVAVPGSEQAGLPQGVAGQGQVATGQPTPLHVLPVEIGMKAMTGMKEFAIRLDPAELGRVDVKLEISDKGEVSARLVVDRVETLHLLQRDARTLERAFEQAGLKPSDAGVEINLRDQSDQSAFRQQRQQDEAPRRSRGTAGESAEDEIAITGSSAPVRRLVRLGGVDLSV